MVDLSRENEVRELGQRIDDLCRLADRVETLEDNINALEQDRDRLLKEVKDIMTAFEGRVLKEIENLTEARIEPIDKINSGLMLTIADLTASVTALLDIYEEESPADNFSSRFNAIRSEHQKSLLKTMKEAHGLSETETSKGDPTPAADRNANGT